DVDEKLDTLLASPAFRVDSRIDHEPARAKRDRLQISDAPDRIVFIGTELVRELFGIESPTLGIRVERKQLPDQRHSVRVFALPDVARDRFMKGQIRQAVLAVQTCRAKVDP